METILLSRNGLDFGVTDSFKGELWAPIIKNLLLKSAGEWDDYDEVFHCTRLIETIRAAKKMTLDFHFIRKNQQIIGILLAAHGELDYCLFF